MPNKNNLIQKGNPSKSRFFLCCRIKKTTKSKVSDLKCNKNKSYPQESAFIHKKRLNPVIWKNSLKMTMILFMSWIRHFISLNLTNEWNAKVSNLVLHNFSYSKSYSWFELKSINFQDYKLRIKFKFWCEVESHCYL